MKPHGRVTYTIEFGRHGPTKSVAGGYIDLSVIKPEDAE